MQVSEAIVDRYSLDGEPSLAIHLPPGVRPHRPNFTVQGNKALGIAEDEFGRQTVLILEIPSK